MWGKDDPECDCIHEQGASNFKDADRFENEQRVNIRDYADLIAGMGNEGVQCNNRLTGRYIWRIRLGLRFFSDCSQTSARMAASKAKCHILPAMLPQQPENRRAAETSTYYTSRI